jgi:predicted NBD/HSP70 family sugar kinase
MQTKKAEIMGIDVGGTKILLQTFDEKMNVVAEAKVSTQTKKGEKGFTAQLFDLIEKHLTKDIKAIGIALPGIVHRTKGLLVKAPHLPTRINYPIKKLLEQRFKRRVYVDHDINAFLWAEKDRPALRKYKNIIAVMVGTGLGGAILNDGKLLYGASGYAGEVGHIIIRQDGPLKSLEQNTSGSFVPKIAKMMKAKKLDADDPKVNRYLLEQLGVGLANLNLIFNPGVIVLGGSVYRYHLADNKKQLQKMIAMHSLDGKSPKLIDADRTTSVAKGVAMMALKQ